MITGFILPSATPWSLIEVYSDDTDVFHYAHVYDGAGTLTTYINTVAQTPVAHTPSLTAYELTNTVYNTVTTYVELLGVTYFDVAFSQTQIDTDYALYTPGSGTPVSNSFDSSLSVTNTPVVLHDTDLSTLNLISSNTDTQEAVSKLLAELFDTKETTANSVLVLHGTYISVLTIGEVSNLIDTKLNVVNITQTTTDTDLSTLNLISSNTDTDLSTLNLISSNTDTDLSTLNLISSNTDTQEAVSKLLAELFDTKETTANSVLVLHDTYISISQAGVVSAGTLTPETIQAIADAVWSKIIT